MTPAKFDPLLTKKINMFIWSLKDKNKFIPLIEPFVHWDDIGVKCDSIQKSNFHAHPLEFTIWQFMFIPFWNLKFYFIHLSKISTFWKCPLSKICTFQKYPLLENVVFGFCGKNFGTYFFLFDNFYGDWFFIGSFYSGKDLSKSATSNKFFFLIKTKV